MKRILSGLTALALTCTFAAAQGGFPIVCDPANDDALEQNDDCRNTVPFAGVASNLYVSKVDPDYYSFTVAEGATLMVDLSFLNADGDVNMYLYDSVANCALETVWLAGASSTSDNESISWTNNAGTGHPICLILKVDIWSGSGADCNTYDLAINGTTTAGCWCELDTFCDPMDVNCTGVPTRLCGYFHLLTTNPFISGLHLECTDGPPGQIGYYLVSENILSVPLVVGNGRLCLGGPLGRYNVGGSRLNSISRFNVPGTLISLAGNSDAVFPFLGAGYDVPREMPPTVNGPIVWGTGQTYRFQVWHRDICSSGSVGSNFSNAVSVTF